MLYWKKRETTKGVTRQAETTIPTFPVGRERETTQVSSDHEERSTNHSMSVDIHHTAARYPPDLYRHSLSIITSHPSRSHVSVTARNETAAQ